MPRRLLVLVIAIALTQTALVCAKPGQITIVEPTSHLVDTFSFPVEIEIGDDLLPETVEVKINGESILGQLSGTTLLTGVIDPGSPLRNQNLMVVRAQEEGGHWFWFWWVPPQTVQKFFPFSYLPPGKANAHRIKHSSELLTGPLAHNRVGDWMLKNGEARFVVQDVAQRELYSVGEYGGNLIDAELLGNPGKDNFLEVQPGLNIESVINAQTVEIVNDGQNGLPAAVRTCGPDDLLDFVNPSSQVNDLGIPGITFPALADDKDLEIEGCTTYTLAPGDTHVSMETEVFNNYTLATLPPEVPNPLALFVGDWLNPAGELDTFARPGAPASPVSPASNGIGPAVTSSLGTLGFTGFDEGAGTDYAFTQVPLPSNPSVGSFVFISGVLVVLHSQNVLLTLVGLDPIRFTVPVEESLTYTRYFGVGDGSSATAVDLENKVKGTNVGTLEGCVSVAGTPVAGAKVTVGSPLLTTSDKIAAHFTTRPGACPNYSGTVAVGVSGMYSAAAGLKGHLYQGGAALPPLQAVTIVSGMTTTADFDLPATGALSVSVTDSSGGGVPARVTVVGFDPSPEPIVSGPALPGFGGDALGLLNDVNDFLPFGIAAVGYADENGEVEFELEPGMGLYQVYVSRGTEYSAWRSPLPIDVTAGATTHLDAQIARVVDTSGFISSDFHVHGIRSADSRVSDLHRIESYSAEGVENVIMTDHHVHTDLRPAIQHEGMGDFLTATIGEEITTFDYGHFNAYPLLLDAASPTATFKYGTQLSGGSTDWAQGAPAGQDFPIYGALNATPSEILGLATTGALSVPGVTTAQINHIDSHFAPLKIDTSLMPPADGLGDAGRQGRRLPDTSAVPNLFQHFPALELWNGDSRGDQSQFLNERIGIWFNHLNQGLDTTFIADTDSHRFTNLNTAGARSWTASPTDEPASIDPSDVAAAVDAGRAVGGQGLYVQTRLLATDGSGDVADLTLAGDTSMTDVAGNVELEINVQSAGWSEWDRIEVYANASTFTAGSPYLFGAVPSVVLDEGDCDPTTTGDGDFDISITPDVGGVAGADRHSATVTVPFAGLTESTWFVVVVRGTDGECAPMFPVYPDNLSNGSNATLADLVDGNVGESGTMALGATNALYFEP